MWLFMMAACGANGGGGGSETCDLYLDCTAAVAPSQLDGTIAAYGDGGSCWEEDAIDCDAACTTGLEDLRDTDPSPDCYLDELEDDCFVVANGPELCDDPDASVILALAAATIECGTDEASCAADAIRTCGPDVIGDVVACDEP